ncbi:MAG: serine/threonine-protein kinase [Planctomycetota bacterium]
MMTAQTCHCPSEAKWEAILAGTVSESESNEAMEYLSSCTRCQDVIDRVAKSGSLSKFSIEQIVGRDVEASPPTDSAYWKAVASVSMELRAIDTPSNDMVETQIRAAHSIGREASDGDSESDPIQRTIETEINPSPTLPFLADSDDPAYVGRLRHFEIARVIGRGGMGIVLEAFDTQLQRVVAIKVLNPEYAKNDVARQRFCREGRAAAAISHENVVAMHQVVREDEGKVAFLVMQYIEGATLEALLQQGNALEPPLAGKYSMQIAAGLSAAHERDMVHRDIKPANILVERSTDRVKLTDFGLARATDDVKLTKTGMVTGTPLYMSPEQATGGTADERSDLFSLGAVMYEMLTGKSAFGAPSIVGVMKRIMDETPTAPAKLNPAVPASLSELTMALLEKNPSRRPESAEFVAQTIAEILSEYGPISPLQSPSLGTASAPRSRPSGTHRLVSRNTLFVSWIVGVLGLLSLTIAIGFWAFMPSRGTETKGADFPVTVLDGSSGTVWAVDFDTSGEQVLTAIEDGSVKLWDVGTHEMVRSFDAHRGIVWMIQYHPTQAIVATSGNDGSVKLWDSKTLELLQEWDAGSPVRKIAFSPDGTRIVGGSGDGTIYSWHIKSGVTLAEVTQAGAIHGIDWSPDGKLIASVGSDKQVRIWDAETLEPRQTMSGHQGAIYNVRFAPVGNRIATVGWGKEINIWNTNTGQLETQLESEAGDNWSVEFCADGKHAVVAGSDGVCRIWDLDEQTLVSSLVGHESDVHNVSLDPIHYRIATSGRDGTVRIWDLSELAPE